MAKNFVQEGDTLTVAAPVGGAVSGAPYQLGAINGVFLSTAAEGELVAFMTEGVFELEKEAALGIFAGEEVYLNAGIVTTTAGADPAFGVCIADADASALNCKVKLK